jgi:hypothetical protein
MGPDRNKSLRPAYPSFGTRSCRPRVGTPATRADRRNPLITVAAILWATACSSSPLGPGGSDVASVELDLTRMQLLVGGEAGLRATVRNSAGVILPSASVRWATGDESVVSVGPNGQGSQVADTRGRGMGGTSVSARAGVHEDTTSVSVVDTATVVAVRIANVASGVMELGTSVQLRAEGADEGGEAVLGVTGAWSSSAPSIVDVSPTGLATPRGVGTATIRFEALGHRTEKPIQVVASPGISSAAGLPAFPGAEGFGALALNACRSLPIAVHRVTSLESEGLGRCTTLSQTTL